VRITFILKQIIFAKATLILKRSEYDDLNISHVLRNLINFVWERYIMSCFTKLSLINDI